MKIKVRAEVVGTEVAAETEVDAPTQHEALGLVMGTIAATLDFAEAVGLSIVDVATALAQAAMDEVAENTEKIARNN